MKEPASIKDRNKIAEYIYVFWIAGLTTVLGITFFICYTEDYLLQQISMGMCILLLISAAADRLWSDKTRAFLRLTASLALCLGLLIISKELAVPNPVLSRYVRTAMYGFEGIMVFCFWRYIVKELNICGRKCEVMNDICMGASVLGTAYDMLSFYFDYPLAEPGSPLSCAVWGAQGWLSNLDNLIIYSVIAIAVVTSTEVRPSNKLGLMTFAIPPVVAIICTRYLGHSYLFIAYTFSLLIIFINVYLQRSRQLLEQKVINEKQATALMISQIQPHFLYNTLTTISNLCATDPEEAEETTVLFARYLRANLDSLKSEEPVPFTLEMDHIRTYVEIEKKRFGDKLNIEFDLEDTDFDVPSLGLQPIVENSIKHGIRGKDEPGHLKVSCRKKGSGHEVIIEDDGVGFDPLKTEFSDGHSHVGIENVRSRLMKMCRAEMDVESRPGCGCRTSIYFPDAA